MKGKIYLLLAAVASLFSSCDMDLAPIGSLDDQTAILSLNDAQRFRNGFYTGIRSFTTSKFFSYADIQCDMFNGLVINGNRMGSIANGDILPGDDDITSYWASCYGLIANSNYFLEVMEPLLAQAEADGDPLTLAKYKCFIGEAHFFRGYYYAMLFDRWCQLYDPAIADQEGYGIPIITKWDPSPDRSKYPGRPSMNTTIEFIKSELQMAYDALAEFQEIDPAEIDPYYSSESYPYVLVEPNASYVSTWAVRAMQARIALWLRDYQDALNISEEIINSGIYKLANTSTYKNMWTQDKSNEVIFRPYMNSQELGNSIGSAWIGTQSTDADYIPTPQSISQYKEPGINSFKQDRDCRYTAFIEQRTLQTAFGDVDAPCFVKFPGNKDLMTGASVNLANMPKVFRLSEIYLIAMESAAELQQEALANQYLETYMKNRILSYKHDTLSGASLIEQIRKERGLELNGEGFRLSDLRRWKKGFSRSGGSMYESNPDIAVILTKAGLAVSYDGDDYRYTWPIPADELQSNPQMAGQQNPGY